jgi:putative transposase
MHHHSTLVGFTPHQVFSGEYLEIAKIRQTVMDKMYDAPFRVFHQRPYHRSPEEVCINLIPPGADDKS